jgi:hypothetical protein
MSSRRLSLVSVAVALSLAAVPAGAAAAPGWVAATDFPLPADDIGIGGLPGPDEVLYQDGGIATEAFLQVESISPLQTTLHVGTLAPGATYAEQLTLPSGGGAFPVEPRLAVAPDGAAVLAWIELLGEKPEGSPLRYRAAYRPAGGDSWEAPFTVATDEEVEKGVSPALTVAISADGAAAVGVQHFAAGESTGPHKQPNDRIDIAVKPAGSAWQSPQRLSPVAQSAESLSLGFDGQGDLTAAYRLRYIEGSTSEDDLYTPVVRRLAAGGAAWGLEEQLVKPEVPWTTYAPVMGVDEVGDAVIAYQYDDDPASKIETRAVTRQGPNGGWTAPAAISPKSSAPEAAGVAPDGMAYVLYSYQGSNSGESCEGVERAPVDGSFSGERCVSLESEESFSGSIAFLGDDAYFAWRANPPGEQSDLTIQGARWGEGETLPEVAQNLDTPGLRYGTPTLVPDGEGSVVAFYTNPGDDLRAAAYDAGPPILLSSGVPSTAMVGQPVTVSAALVDLWAGVGAGQPTWSFGDGSAPVAGATATHAFGAPGVYTITLNAADALGNATTESFTITVVPQTGIPPAAISRDTRPPSVTLALPHCARRLSRKACRRLRASTAAWRTLSGAVTDPAPSSGIAGVEVAVYRTHGVRIEAFSGGRFRRAAKAKARRTFVAARVSGTRWTLRLPKLSPGTYTILVRARDRAGNESAIVTRSVRLR